MTVTHTEHFASRHAQRLSPHATEREAADIAFRKITSKRNDGQPRNTDSTGADNQQSCKGIKSRPGWQGVAGGDSKIGKRCGSGDISGSNFR